MGIFNIKSLKDRYLSNGPTESTQKRQGQESSANEQDPTIKSGVSRLAAIRDSSFHQETSPDRPPQDPKNPKKRVGEDVQTLLEQSTAAGTDLIEVVTVKPTGDTAPVPTAADHNTAADQDPAPQNEPADAPAHVASKNQHHSSDGSQPPRKTSSKDNAQKAQGDSQRQAPATGGDVPVLGAIVSSEPSTEDGEPDKRVVLVPSAYGLDVPPADTDSVDLPDDTASKAKAAGQEAAPHRAPHVMTSEMATNHYTSQIPAKAPETPVTAWDGESPEKVTLVQGVYGIDVPQEAGENLDTPTRGVPSPTASATSSPNNRHAGQKDDTDTPGPALVRGVYGLDVPETPAETADGSAARQDFPGQHAQPAAAHQQQTGVPQLSSQEREYDMLAGEETVELAPIHVREALEAQRAAQKAAAEKTKTTAEAESEPADATPVPPVQEKDADQQEPRKVTTASFSLSPESVGEAKNRVSAPAQGAGLLEAVFVCTGNVARSASAEVIAQSLASQYGLEDNWVFTSAGTAALAGSPIYKYIGNELEGRGYDPSQFRAKQLTADMIERATLLLVAEQDHADWILREWPQYHTKVHLMKQVARIREKASRRAEPISFIYGYTEAAHDTDSIADPYRRGRTACRVAVDEVEQSLQVILPWLVRARV